MDVFDSNGTKLEYSAVLANLPITESCEHVEELMKADHIVLSWRDSEKYTLPVGAYITYKGVNYALLEPYSPEQKSDDEFEYTPNFQHPKMYLGKVPFRFPTTDTEGNSITLLEWPYSGDIDTLLTFFCRTMESVLGLEANTFNYSILGEIDMVVSTTFSSVDILSALSDIANKLKCEWHIDWDYKILYFGHINLSRDEVEQTILEVGVNVGTPSVRSSKEGFYNTYEPQGSTRNISKRAASGEYVQGDVRLALNEEDYPDKVIYTNESGTVIASLPQGVKKYIKPLIFDNIFPKLDLYVYDVRCRERYLLDDNGKKIVDHYEGSTPVYKRYAVWYMRLAYPTKENGHVTEWHDYTINPKTDIISGKNLGGAFQPNTYEGAESFPLAGRGKADDGGYGFELYYHTTGEVIPANPNDGDTGVVIKAGDYEIVFQQQNDYILPTTASQGIIPKGVKVDGQEVTDLNGLTNLDDGQKGNIVDLYNIVIGSAYTESAQDELANKTLKYITNQFKDNNSYTLKSDVVAFKKRIDQDELLHTDSSLYIGEKVIYKNGDYELETRVMKLVTKLDYAFVQEITVGNEVLKGSTTTLKEQVKTILSGGVGNGSGGGGVDAGAVRKIVQAYANPRFLSKLNDDTAQGFITMLKGLQVGANFVPDILGEGGCLRMRDDGKVELVTDILYARMRAYFDSVVIREYKHESGNRIVSPAQGFNAARIEWIQLVEEEIEGETEGETIIVTREVILDQTDANKSLVDFFRCYWRVDDGEKKAENQFVIGDLAFCEHADVVNGTLVTKRYWRVVRGRNTGNTTTNDGEAWIDLSNAHNENGEPVLTTITWTGQGGTEQTLSVKSFENSSNSFPEAHDDICMLGCTTDITRQGAIIEYVSGVNAPAYQIYQGLGASASDPYSLNNKNQISIGYNTSSHRAEMNVFGDAYIGARDRSTYIEYNQGDAQNPPQLNVKAKMTILPNSTYEGKTAQQFVQENQRDDSYDDSWIQPAIDAVQAQIDGELDTWYYTGVPTLNNLPASEWATDDTKKEHVGDLYYDKNTGYAYRFLYDDENSTYYWTQIHDDAISEALRIANDAQDTADHKRRVFICDSTHQTPTPPYDAGDLWVNVKYPWETGATYNDEILKCDKKVPRTEDGQEINTFSINDWSLANGYSAKLANFVNNTYAPFVTQISGQVDKKAETFRQADNPASDWYIVDPETQEVITDTRAHHVGDIWMDISANGGNKTYIYQNTAASGQDPYYEWVAQDVPEEVFDKIDGKAAIYVEWNSWVVDNVSQLQDKDLFIPSANVTPTGSTKTYKANKVYRWKASNSTWNEIDYLDSAALQEFIEGDYAETIGALENQLDKKAETWYQAENPATPWYVVDPETQEVTTDTRADHVGDLWYKTTDDTTWYYKATTTVVDEQEVTTYEWVQQNVPLAVFDKIDGKADIFVSKPSTYNKYDMWIIESGLAAADIPEGCKRGDIVIADHKRTNSYTKGDWKKKDRYTDDSAFNGYIDEMLNGSHTSGSSSIIAAATQRAIMSALGGSTIIEGGLMLTSMIALRQNTGTAETPQYTTWAGISGIYDNTLNEQEEYVGVKGHGIAAWYGGAKVDIEDKSNYWTEEQIAAWEALTDEQKAESPLAAKSLFRMDGSGYLASGNITWKANGELAISDITSIQPSGSNTNVLNDMIQFSSAFHFNTVQGGSTILNIVPQYPFYSLYLYDTSQPNNRSHVASQKWVDDHYVTKTFFRQLFRAFKPNATAGQPDVEVEPNTIDNTISNIKAMVGLWTEQYLSALGHGSDGGGGGGSSVLYGLNDVSPNASNNQVLGIVIEDGETTTGDGYVLTYNGTTQRWYAAPTAETYVLPKATTTALGGMKASNVLSSEVTLTSGAGTTANRYYGVQIDSVGKAFVNIPWENTTYTLASLMGSTAKGSATQPIYWDGSAFQNTTYTLGKSVPANAEFTDTNTWRNVLVSGTEKLGNGTDTKGLNFVGDGKTTITFLAAGTDEGQSGSADYATLKISSTWRGIQDNLTSDSSTDSLSAKQGKALKGSITTLEGYFTNGVAKSAAKLTTVSKTAWGRTFWTAGGVPDSISGALDSVTNITMSGFLKIGDIYIGQDTNGNLEIYKLGENNAHVAANLYARGGIAALGQTSSGGGGGSGDVTWTLLADDTDERQIAMKHLSVDSEGYTSVLSTLTGYTTSGKNYAVQKDASNHLYVNVPWENTTYTLAGLMGSSAKGGATQPIYWDGTEFKNTTYTLGKSVPADAKFTDTTYSFSNADATLAWSTRTKIATTGGTDIYVTLPANPNTNTWRNIYLGGTSKVGTATNTKALNFLAGSNIDITYTAAGTGEGESGSADYFNIEINAKNVYDSSTSRTKNTVLAAPNGSNGAATFRALVAADIPSLAASKITSGTFDSARIPSLAISKITNLQTSLDEKVNLSDTEQTIESTISSLTKGVVEFYRSSGNHYSMIGFANKDGNGEKQTLGFIGFKNNAGEIAYRTASGTDYTIWHAGNDGADSGLDADLLDGTHKSGLFTALSSNSTTKISITIGGTTKTLSTLYASHAAQLTTSRSLWGNSFNGTGDINGNITMAATDGTYIQIGGARIVWDNTNKALKVIQSDNSTAANFYATGAISALGQGVDGGGGGGQGDVTWALLASQATGGRTIHSSYISGALANYLPLSGGTMNNQAVISRAGNGTLWVYGRNTPIIKTTSYTGYNTILSMKTTNGSWDLGVYESDKVYLSYVSDTSYNAGTNETTYQLVFPKKNGTLAVTSDIPTNNNQLTNGAGYITSSSLNSYLPLSGGSNNKMTGTLYIGTSLGITDASGNGLLCYHPGTWNGVSSSQWGLGATDSQGVIRSSASNLVHFRGDTAYDILDSSNSSVSLSGSTLTVKINGTSQSLTNTNTWRGIYVAGTEKLTTAISSKGLNFVAGSNVSLSFAAAGTGSGQSGNANYGTLTVSATDTTYSAGSGLLLNGTTFSIASNVLVQGSVIDTHHEGSCTITLDGANELYAFYDRNGTCDAYEVEQNTTLTNQTLTRTSTSVAALNANVFNGVVGYNQNTVYSGQKFAVYDLVLPTTYSFDTTFFWSFGNDSWKPNKMRVLVGLYSANGFTYTSKYSDDACPAFGKVDVSSGSSGFNRLRIVVSSYSRLSCFGITNFGSQGLNTTYMNRSIDSGVYRNINPAKDGIWSLGTSTERWKEIRAVNLYGSLTGNASSATKLQTARTINGTSFDGSANITTANWGTARNISIADSDSTNTGTAVSVNGSAAVTLKLPSTIKATLSGNAASASKLTTVSKTAWGQTFWTSGGVPTSISGALSSVTNITMSGYIKIGDAYLSYDSTNNAIRVSANANGTGVVNFYAIGGVSALGQGVDGGGGGQGDVTWDLLAHTATNDRFIDSSYISGTLANYLPLSGGTISNTAWGSQLTLKRQGGTPSLYFDNGTYKWWLYPDTSGDDKSKWFVASNQSGSEVSEYLITSAHTKQFGLVYNSADIGNNQTASVNDMVSSGGSNATFGMVCSGTDNPTGSGSWVHVWSQQWTINVANNWVSQIAIGTQAKNGMWYRCTNTEASIVGVAWKRVIDSGNIGSQSVNYAASAGSVAWSNVSSHPTKLSQFTNDSGYVTSSGVTSITLKAGTGISLDTDNTAITSTGTRTITNSGVRATTINGNYLRVNTNGTNADLTIPYATSASSATTATSATKDGSGNVITSTYVKLDGGTNEQTIKSSISTLSKGVINLWRNSGDHYTFLGFSNGTTETYIGGIGFKSQSDHNLYRKDSSNYYKIWDENNDGSGSGLDADTLDGQHASAFASNSSRLLTVNGTNYTFYSSATSTINLDDVYLKKSGGSISGTLGVSGNTTIGGTLTAKNIVISDTNAIGHLTFSRNSYNYINCSAGGGKIGFITNGYGVGAANCSLLIDSNGYIGIGTTSPAYKLDVVGVSRSDYHVFYNTAHTGEAGYIGRGGSSSNDLYFCGFSDVALRFLTNSSERMTITSDGSVGIGTNSPSYKLHVNGNGYYSSSLTINGNMSATGSVTCLTSTSSSDIRMKNVVSRELPLNIYNIADAPTIRFTWKKHPELGAQVGSIAQYWQQVLPEVVKVGNDNEHTLSLSYGVAALVAAITTARKVVDHEKRITELEKENRELREEISRLKIA